jgi:hypothetical protein
MGATKVSELKIEITDVMIDRAAAWLCEHCVLKLADHTSSEPDRYTRRVTIDLLARALQTKARRKTP